MKPPRGWTLFVDEVWRLLAPAYGLVQSGQLGNSLSKAGPLSRDLSIFLMFLSSFFCEGEVSSHLSLPNFSTTWTMLESLKLSNNSRTSSLRSLMLEDWALSQTSGSTVFVFGNIRTSPSPSTWMNLWVQLAVLISSIRARTTTTNLAHHRKSGTIRDLLAKLNFLGNGIPRQASLVASKMQQYVSRLKVSTIRQLNAALTHIRSLKSHLYLKSPQEPLSNRPELLQVLSLCDAASGTS